jgi:hypothetical protein
VSDEFTGDDDDKLGDQWRIFNADKASWKLSGGWLSIRTQDGDVFRERDDLQNLFLQHAPAGDYSVTTRLDFNPTENYQNAQLCVWEDHNNYLKIAIVHDNGLHLEIAREERIDYKKRLFPAGQQRYLRITKIGDSLLLRRQRRRQAVEHAGRDVPGVVQRAQDRHRRRLARDRQEHGGTL